ncbi:hypothetical protein [Pseudomonas sp. KU43P]|uniref:hypothetical protein n=1 Tax=Pseudomonas sp. KU43P TaxID=2487887 RepID=UPI002955C026|nr:hypothetical protein [Pseudomonas sp. KU43P]
MKITKMVRPFTILTHLTRSQIGQDFPCKISCLNPGLEALAAPLKNQAAPS